MNYTMTTGRIRSYAETEQDISTCLPLKAKP